MKNLFSGKSKHRLTESVRRGTHRPPNLPPSRSSGFSLVELLVVVVIIGVVMRFALPAVGSLLKGSSLSRAANMLTDEMSRARQYAISKNRAVEVRFYRFADPEVPGENVNDPTTGSFRGLQCFEIPSQQLNDEDVPLPIGSFVRFPDGIVMNDTDDLSNLIGPTSASFLQTAPGPIDPELPGGVGKKYLGVPFRFLPDGSTTLAKYVDTKAKVKGKGNNGYGYGIGNGNGNTGLGYVSNLNGNAYGLQKKGSGKKNTIVDAQWYITVHSLADKAKAANGTAPPNFFTWMIDPVAGTSKVLRPAN